MIAVIFEVMPAEGKKDAYLDIAANLKPLLHEVEGFISVERFQSITDPSKLLSLSFFEDESALDNWRTLSEHRAAQKAGRNGMFDDYRLRVVSVMRDYGPDRNRDQAPGDSNTLHCPHLTKA